MNIFWADQIAIWSVLLMSIFYTRQMSSPLFSVLVLLVLFAASLSVYLTVFCDWSKSYPTEHATLHGIAVLAFHCIIAGLPC